MSDSRRQRVNQRFQFFQKIPIIRKFLVFSKNPYNSKISSFFKNPYNSKISSFFKNPNNMPAAGGNFLGILEAFLYQKHIPEYILDVFFAQNTPQILKNFPPAAGIF